MCSWRKRKTNRSYPSFSSCHCPERIIVTISTIIIITIIIIIMLNHLTGLGNLQGLLQPRDRSSCIAAQTAEGRFSISTLRICSFRTEIDLYVQTSELEWSTPLTAPASTKKPSCDEKQYKNLPVLILKKSACDDFEVWSNWMALLLSSFLSLK